MTSEERKTKVDHWGRFVIDNRYWTAKIELQTT